MGRLILNSVHSARVDACVRWEEPAASHLTSSTTTPIGISAPVLLWARCIVQFPAYHFGTAPGSGRRATDLDLLGGYILGLLVASTGFCVVQRAAGRQ